MNWPKVSQIIYPNQSVRVNTGWSANKIDPKGSVTTYPHQIMVNNNLGSVPVYYDAGNTHQ